MTLSGIFSMQRKVYIYVLTRRFLIKISTTFISSSVLSPRGRCREIDMAKGTSELGTLMGVCLLDFV